MVINHNLSAMFAQRTLGVTGDNIQNDVSKLSSGMKINRAGDDRITSYNVCYTKLLRCARL